MKVAILTLGCKLNQAESDEIKRILRSKGHQIIDRHTKADVCVIRACAVTMGASQTVRELIRKEKRNGSFVIACGCLENTDLPEIDFVAKNDSAVLKKIYFLARNKKYFNKKIHDEELLKTRCSIKIQSGCNFNCAYCIIPKFRGESHSIPSKSIVNKILARQKEGYKEIVLTGVNICQYNDGKSDFAELLKIIIEQTKIERIRLGSIDPRLVTNKLIDIYLSNKRFMPHWHLSLQSGSNQILKKMNRGYTAEQFTKIIKKIRQINNLFSFTTDIIVGFPGETELDFKKTLAIAKKAMFAKIHVFQYSPRGSTSAVNMPNQIRDGIKKNRSRMLILTSEMITKKFAKNFIGKTREVLFENKKTGFWHGFTPEYLPIKYESNINLNNKIKKIKITLQNLESKNSV